MLKEFKEFVMKGNMLDMAVGYKVLFNQARCDQSDLSHFGLENRYKYCLWRDRF